jgi:hypothetical protein
MSDGDPFESELRGLVPENPSPRFLRQFERNLARRERSARLRTAALVTVVAATASITTLVWTRREPAPLPPKTITGPESVAPTLADFRRAADQSPQAFDALLRQSPAPSDAHPLRPIDVNRLQWN